MRKALAVLAVMAVACTSGDSAANDIQLPSRIDVSAATAVEIQTPPSGESVQLITMTGDEAVAALVGTLDVELVAELGSCSPDVEIRFYDASGGVVTVGFRCDGAPWLVVPADAAWSGHRARAPEAFVAIVDAQLALLP